MRKLAVLKAAIIETKMCNVYGYEGAAEDCIILLYFIPDDILPAFIHNPFVP